MRLTKAGSSKVFMENVVQCEPYAGVTGFFQHGGERFMDAVPKEWDWSGRAFYEMGFRDVEPRAYCPPAYRGKKPW